MPSVPLALTLIELLLIAILLALIAVVALSALKSKLSGPAPPPPPPPPAPYEQPFGQFLAKLKEINDADPPSVSADDCTKLRALLKAARDKGLPSEQATPAQEIVDKLCPQ